VLLGLTPPRKNSRSAAPSPAGRHADLRPRPDAHGVIDLRGCSDAPRSRPRPLWKWREDDYLVMTQVTGMTTNNNTSISLPPFVSRRGLSNTNQRLSQLQNPEP
jgi:hypothetical protein